MGMSSRSSSRYALPAPLVDLTVGSAPQEAPLPWIDPSVREMLQAVAGGLSLCLCAQTRPISQTGTVGVILLRADVAIVRLDVRCASQFCSKCTWARAGEINEEGVLDWGGKMALKGLF